MRIANSWRSVVLLVSCKAVPTWAAQSLPDAGSLQYGAPTELPARLPVPGRATTAEAVNDVPASTGPQVTVRRFVLDAHVELDEVGVVNRGLSLDLLQPRGLRDRDRILRHRVNANARCDLLLDLGQRAAGCRHRTGRDLKHLGR